MTIHSDHPFLPPESERSPIRRLRGRLTSGVTVWTTYAERPGGRSAGRPQDGAVGLTVSSMLVAEGEPGRVLALLDPESDLCDAVLQSRTAAISLLSYGDRGLADAFAGTAPAPGGPFTLRSWDDTEWGPVLRGSPTWAGCRMLDDAPREVGWSLLVEAVIQHVELAEEERMPLVHRRGRYIRGD